MPPISTKASRVPLSPIRRFNPMLSALHASGVVVHQLQIGQPDVPTPASFFAALREFSADPVAYEPSTGNATLRTRLVDYFARHSVAVTTNHMVVTTGGSEALALALAATLNAGDEVLTFEPFYANYATFVAQADARLVATPTSIDDNFALGSVDAILAAVTPRTKAILFSNPGNPTGTVLTRDEMQRIVDVARRHDLFIIADEVYREFTYDGHEALSILEFDGVDERAIVVDSVSKRYSACGARVGWLVSRNDALMSAVLRLCMARLSVATVEQAAIARVIENSDAEIERAKAAYAERRELAYSFLRAHHIACSHPTGALYMIADLRVPSQLFVEYMLSDYVGIDRDRETVCVAPAEGFYQTDEGRRRGATQVRIAFVLEAAKLERALHHLVAGVVLFRHTHRDEITRECARLGIDVPPADEPLHDATVELALSSPADAAAAAAAVPAAAAAAADPDSTALSAASAASAASSTSTSTSTDTNASTAAAATSSMPPTDGDRNDDAAAPPSPHFLARLPSKQTSMSHLRRQRSHAEIDSHDLDASSSQQLLHT